MDMEGLHSFIAVAREKSISKAAQALHVTQPTLSARLRKLEDGLGVTLLERGWNGIRLTKHGRFFLSYSIEMFQELEEAATLLRSRETRELERPIDAITNDSRLRIGVDPFFSPSFVPLIIQAIRRASSDTECKFVIKNSGLLLDLIECGSLDIVLHYEAGSRPRLKSQTLLNDRFVLLIPAESYPDIREDLGNAPLLKDKQFVLFESASLLSYPEVTRAAFMQLFGNVPERFHIVRDIEAALDIVAGGFGYTFMPVTSIYQMLGEPLPFRAILMPPEYLNLPVRLSYPKRPAAELPVERIAADMLNALKAYAADVPEPFRLL